VTDWAEAEDDIERLRKIALAEALSKVEDGISFAEREAGDIKAVWGIGDDVLWSRDEPFMLYGPQGVGKTTLAHRLLLGLTGVEPFVLGFPVAPEPSILYIAADRPRQARRSWARMVRLLPDEGRDIVRECVRFWPGPLPFDVAQKPDELLSFLRPTGCTAVVLDSLKDMAMDLVKDEVGARLNRALQLLVAEGIQTCALHHPRKGQSGSHGSEPDTVDSVYGSAWLTAGHGSIVSLWGSPGDPIVRFRHLKQAANEVGPFDVILDHQFGMLERNSEEDALALLVHAGPGGLAAADVAKSVFQTTAPSRAQVEKSRRRLELLCDKGLALARRPDGFRGAGTTYVAAAQGNGQMRADLL
jgi:replicative DNA helicase